MYHMITMSVRDLRYRFPQVEARLRAGEEIAITKRKRVIARLVPEKPAKRVMPDFGARLKEIYGNRIMQVSNAKLIALDREDR
jgi:antitoxin (DNA-binding transcriptional repressor) of toxin-antitoxin stability system